MNEAARPASGGNPATRPHPHGYVRSELIIETEERFADPLARDMARRIEIVEDPEGSKVFAARRFHEVPNTVELHAGGRTYRKSDLMSHILGSPGRPMPKAMLEDKFHRLADPAIGHGRAEELLEALYDLRSISNANDLTELF